MKKSSEQRFLMTFRQNFVVAVALQFVDANKDANAITSLSLNFVDALSEVQSTLSRSYVSPVVLR